MRELFGARGPRTSLDRRVGSGRTFAVIRTDLALVKRVAHAHGAKVNDVLLAAVAGGLRTLVCERGETVVGSVSAYSPISLRRGVQAEAMGNLVTQMAVPLPLGVSGSVERLCSIAGETAVRKTRIRPSIGGFRVRGLLGFAFLKLIERQRVSVETADLVGPPMPMYLAGAKLLEIFPLLPLIGHVSLGVGALSYAGQLDIGVVADRDAYPDMDVLAAGIKAELATLETSVGGSAAA
jgi:WS/DGAT/MGAT family acyltransferase